MRARICSAISCAMFARVVWLKSWGAAKSPAFALPRVARTCHAWLARLTRARGRCFLRGRKTLLNDFWYFSSLKSTIKEKLLYDSSRANDVRPYYAGRRGADPYKIKPQVPSTAKTKDICLFAFSFAYTGAKEKAIKKKTPKEDFALCGARQGRLALDPAAF